ncbi:hypothetical protein [Streptomyces cylindrosporus]|uniref:Uncharacterized protein n=1 Tax=Streptomyces cylindrosporus TaxID=2927583 RepID=A0ABS9Y664_9ACTN|nr:hypothetical protein [Streptomyces cylindrosporus]MCI3272708.1 hypothetical protein [Streptomyces cylindrosporus]
MTTTPASPTGFRQRLGDQLSALAAENATAATTETATATASAPGTAPSTVPVPSTVLVPVAVPDAPPHPAPWRRRHWAVRHRLPLAVAGVAAVGVALATLPAHRSATPDPGQATGTAVTSQPQRITTAAYTLQREEDGRVRLAITDAAGKLLDTARLQRDLNSLGVPALVYTGDPKCTKPPTGTGDDSPRDTWNIELAKGGKPILSVRPDRIPAGQHLLVAFPLARTDPDHAGYVIQAGRIDGTPPTCVPALPKSSAG